MVWRICSDICSSSYFKVFWREGNEIKLNIDHFWQTASILTFLYHFFWTFLWLGWRWRWRWRWRRRWRWRHCTMGCTVGIERPAEGKMKGGRWMQKRERERVQYCPTNTSLRARRAPSSGKLFGPLDFSLFAFSLTHWWHPLFNPNPRIRLSVCVSLSRKHPNG